MGLLPLALLLAPLPLAEAARASQQASAQQRHGQQPAPISPSNLGRLQEPVAGSAKSNSPATAKTGSKGFLAAGSDTGLVRSPERRLASPDDTSLWIMKRKTALHDFMAPVVNASMKWLGDKAKAEVRAQKAKLTKGGVVKDLLRQESKVLAEQRLTLDTMAPTREASFATLRYEWRAANFERMSVSAQRTTASAKAAERERLQGLERLRQLAVASGVEANATLANISASRHSIEALRNKSKHFGASVLAGVAALNVSLQGDQSSLEQLRETTSKVEKTAAAVDVEASEVMGLIDKASNEAANASEIALMAVHQATQNALKLKTIRGMVEKVTHDAADAALHKEVVG